MYGVYMDVQGLVAHGLDVVRGVEADAAVLAAFAPPLFVLVF